VKEKENKKNKGILFWIILFWCAVLIPMVLFTLLIYGTAHEWFGELPSFEELENPKSNLASEVFTSDGKVLGKYFYQNRTNVHYEELSEYLPAALIATEDERYRDHSGIDFRSLGRVFIGLVTGQTGSTGGGSTVSQQLAKNLFPRKDLTKFQLVMRKFKEWVIAVRLERQYTKEEIIAMYFNTFDFVNNAVGIKSAATVYFNKTPQELNINESATLVGMLKNPALFNPLRFYDTTLHRRNVVLTQMIRNGAIDKVAFDTLKLKPIEINFQRVDHKEGIAPYFREILRADLKNIFSEIDSTTGELKYRKANGKGYDIYKDGLKIYTTINYEMQSYAEWAMTKYLSEKLQADFFKDLQKKKKNPFDWRVSDEEVDQIMHSAMRRTDRYNVMVGVQCANCGRRGKYVEEIKEKGVHYFECQADDCHHKRRVTPKDSIDIIFNIPVPMTVFSWKGEIDTTLSPMDSIRYYKSFLQSGLMSMDPNTGYIKAWVGGINSKYFAYDHVAQSKRQVGSTFKPFMFAVAIDEGYSPCYEVPNVPVVFKKGEFGLLKDWSPSNSDPKDVGYNVTLKYGLANSMNTVSSFLMKKFGPERVVKMARNLGIKSDLPVAPSLVLGVADLSVYEMVGAFGTFVNKGIYTEPIYITRIEDKDGNVIKEFIPETKEVISEETAYTMVNLMEGVTSYNYNKAKGKKTAGTGIRLRFQSHEYGGFTGPIAGKTGTTQNNSDGWFIGMMPNLVTGVWVGADDRSVRFSRTADGQGANSALPIWGYYMKKVISDSTLKVKNVAFEKPDRQLRIELDCNKAEDGNNFNDNEEPNFGG
jgi:penicillin-binding protein 1A